MNKNILNCGWEPQAVTTGGNVTPAMSIFTFVKFRMACGFLYRQDNFFLINYAHNFHTANLKRKHAEVKRRKWTGAFSEISATRPWTWKRKAFHKILTEAFEIKQGKWSQNPKDSMTPEDENRLLDESIHFFLFLGGLFHTDNFAQEQKETINLISLKLCYFLPSKNLFSFSWQIFYLAQTKSCISPMEVLYFNM